MNIKKHKIKIDFNAYNIFILFLKTNIAMANQTTTEVPNQFLNLAKNFMKSCAKENTKGDEKSVDLLFDLVSRFIDDKNKTSTTNENPVTEDKKDTPVTEDKKDTPVTEFDLTDLINIFIPVSKTIPKATNVLPTKTKYESSFKLVNDLYDVFWHTNRFSELEKFYAKDALFEFVSSYDKNVRWNITSAKKIVKMFENIWAPTIKINDIEVIKYYFDIDKETETDIYCTIKYEIFQTHLDKLSMTWCRFNIHGSDKIVLSKTDNILHIKSHTIFHDKKELIDTIGPY
jgi:hypothetical protein